MNWKDWISKHRIDVLWLVPAAAIALLLFTDPDEGGKSTRDMLLNLLSFSIVITFLHYIRKRYFPYFDLAEFMAKAKEHPIGAGLAVLGFLVWLAALTLGLMGRVHAEPRPDFELQQFEHWRPVLAHEVTTHWPDVPLREYVASLGGHESGCPTLRRMCWNQGARLKSAREEGAGIGQITRAYRADGSERFDALADLRAQHAGELADLTWQTVYLRPDLQIRALVLMSRDNYRQVHRLVRDPQAALAFADAAYNGGLAGVSLERRACAAEPGCDAQRWFGHVELHCRKSHRPIYGTRSPCDINRHHVRDVVLERARKYRGLV